MWGEDAPATVTNSLENQIWRLRQRLGRDVLITRSPGYVLDVDPEQVDALRLELLLARARASSGEEKATTLRAAAPDLLHEPVPRGADCLPGDQQARIAPHGKARRTHHDVEPPTRPSLQRRSQ